MIITNDLLKSLKNIVEKDTYNILLKAEKIINKHVKETMCSPYPLFEIKGMFLISYDGEEISFDLKYKDNMFYIKSIKYFDNADNDCLRIELN